MQNKSFFLTMSDGVEINVTRWAPDNEENIKGIVQLHHGLAEHCMRYDRFGSILAENGYVLNAYDMRGHGRTAENAEKKGNGRFGKLTEKDGFNRVIEDLHEITLAFKKDFPGKKTILFGHSFGSFVSQGFIEKYSSDIDACVLCGTSGPKGAVVDAGAVLVNIVKFFEGPDKCSKLLDYAAFGSYNKKIENPKTKNAWISRSEANVSVYEDDKWCGIPLTNSFFHDLMSGLKMIHKPENMKKIRKDLPVFFIFGADDPVGNYGKSIEKLRDIYISNGMTNVQLKAYADDRHEILNEVDKEDVEKDVLTFINSIV